jgi:hypothetical protein
LYSLKFWIFPDGAVCLHRGYLVRKSSDLITAVGKRYLDCDEYREQNEQDFLYQFSQRRYSLRKSTDTTFSAICLPKAATF